MTTADTAIVLGRDDPVRAGMNRLESMEGGHWVYAASLGGDPVSDASASGWQRLRSAADVVMVPSGRDTPRVEKFISEQEFEACVLSVDEAARVFWARLVDHTAGRADEEAEFSFDEVPSDDWGLIVPGALFSWNIGLEWRDGQTRRVSEIRFRRFFRFSRGAIAEANEQANRLAQLIAEINAQPAGDVRSEDR